MAICVWLMNEQGQFRRTQKLQGHQEVALSPDGRWLVSGYYGETIRLWQTDNQGRFQQVQTLEAHSSTIRAIAFSPDGKRMASGSDDNTICLWHAVNIVPT